MHIRVNYTNITQGGNGRGEKRSENQLHAIAAFLAVIAMSQRRAVVCVYVRQRNKSRTRASDSLRVRSANAGSEINPLQCAQFQHKSVYINTKCFFALKNVISPRNRCGGAFALLSWSEERYAKAIEGGVACVHSASCVASTYRGAEI